MAAYDRTFYKIRHGLCWLGDVWTENNLDFNKISCVAADVLFALYKIATSKCHFTDLEKQILEPIIPPALQALDHKIVLLEIYIGYQSLDVTLMQRSGIQFLIDEFQHLECLQTYITDNLQLLDESIKTFEEDPNYYLPRSESFYLEVSKLPDHHWWFQEE